MQPYVYVKRFFNFFLRVSFMSLLSERLKSLRTKKKLLQQDIANAISVSLLSYQRYEHGQRVPDADILVKLAKYLQVSADYLLGLDDIPKSDSESILFEILDICRTADEDKRKALLQAALEINEPKEESS